MCDLRPSYKKLTAGGWMGVLRDTDGKIVWKCGHIHRNRDQGSYDVSAVTCARIALKDRKDQ